MPVRRRRLSWRIPPPPDVRTSSLNNLFGFLRQNGGRLSQRARENEFAELLKDEVAKIENLYQASVGCTA
jgi:hypothetical protein